MGGPILDFAFAERQLRDMGLVPTAVDLISSSVPMPACSVAT